MEAQKRWYAETLPLAGAVIVDVGANVGELSEFFFHALQGQGSLLSVEPLAENVAQIEQRIVRLQAADRWRVLQCAVSAQEGESHAAVRKRGRHAAQQHGGDDSLCCRFCCRFCFRFCCREISARTIRYTVNAVSQCNGRKAGYRRT